MIETINIIKIKTFGLYTLEMQSCVYDVNKQDFGSFEAGGCKACAVAHSIFVVIRICFFVVSGGETKHYIH